MPGWLRLEQVAGFVGMRIHDKLIGPKLLASVMY